MGLVRSESGVPLLEFALLASVLLLLLGTIEFGRHVYGGILAASAARARTQHGRQSVGNPGDRIGWSWLGLRTRVGEA